MSSQETVVLTGATSGIGLETARLLAGRFDIVALGRKQDVLDRLKAEVEAKGTKCEILKFDLEDFERYPELFERILDATSTATFHLVHSAGIAEYGTYHEMPFESVQRQLDLMLISPMKLTHGLLPSMLARGGGRIVNVLSVAARTVFPGAAAYASTKAGLLMFGNVLNAEYRRQGIHVTSLLPGATDTPIWDTSNFVPERTDMLSASAVAESILQILELPLDRTIDEIQLMPPKGVL